VLVANREGYVEEIVDLRVAEDAPEQIEQPIYLSPIQLDLQVLTYELTSELPLEGTTVQLLELKPDGEYEFLAEQLNETGNDFVFSLESNREYLIRAEKFGYQSLNNFNLSTVGATETETYQANLYLRRISFQDYLPLAIYFDNDFPDADSRSTTTDTDYTDMIDNYLEQKEAYKLLFTEPMNEEESYLTAMRYEEFFEREVKKGYDDLLAFFNTLHDFLQGGHEVKLILKGYASPRAEDRYNYKLSLRRIVNVENFFRSHENGILMPYIESGMLLFEQMPYGETNTYFFNDLLDDERNSIYSIGASLERRVEVLEAEIRMNADDFVLPGTTTKGAYKD
jgi:hypothetical protein